MSASTQVIPITVLQQRDLDDVANQINKEHEAAGLAVRRGLDHARRAGQLLITTKAWLGHGKFLPWVAEHCEFSQRTAQLYMKLAANWAELEAKCAMVAHLTLNQAIHALTAERSEEVHAGRDDNMVLPGFETPPALQAAIAWTALTSPSLPDFRCPCCGHEWTGDPKPRENKRTLAA